MKIDVRDIRQRCGMSVKTFAEAIGAGPRTVARWEEGGHITPVFAQRLIEVFLGGDSMPIMRRMTELDKRLTILEAWRLKVEDEDTRP